MVQSFRNKSKLKQVFSEFQTNGDDHETQFTDLDFDCLSIICEHLNFTELLNVARANDLLSTVAATVFRPKYSRFQIVVRHDFDIPKKKSSESSNVSSIGRLFQRIKNFGINPKKEQRTSRIEISDNNIILNDYESISDVFTHFGCVIKRLRFINPTDYLYPNEKFLGNLISEYISDSFTTIDFDKTNERLLEYITKPLINVKTVTFRDTNFHKAPESLPLNELFPALHGLAMVCLRGKWQNFFNYHMPYLEEVSIRGISNSFVSNATASLTNVIQKNPQIRDIRVYEVDSDFVHNVNTFLPNLKILQLAKFELQSGHIQFQNVTELRVGFHSLPSNLQFPNLEFIHIQYLPHQYVAWLDFLRKHTHLRRLSLELFDMHESDFHQLTANLHNLVEMIIVQRESETSLRITGFPRREFSKNAIVNFLQSHEKVQHLKVLTSCSIQYKAELKEQLKHAWHITTIDRGLSFVRQGQS